MDDIESILCVFGRVALASFPLKARSKRNPSLPWASPCSNQASPLVLTKTACPPIKVQFCSHPEAVCCLMKNLLLFCLVTIINRDSCPLILPRRLLCLKSLVENHVPESCTQSDKVADSGSKCSSDFETRIQSEPRRQ